MDIAVKIYKYENKEVRDVAVHKTDCENNIE